MTIVIDNSVLSNFALISRIDLLVSAIKDLSPGTTLQVKEEFITGIEKGLLPAADIEWLTILELSALVFLIPLLGKVFIRLKKRMQFFML